MTTTIKKMSTIILSLVIAIIYLQTLYFKFSAHPDSVYIFSKLNLEPYGRIGIGILELITAVLIIVPKTRTIGTIVSLSVILGAIASHLGPLGIEVLGDGGKVFYLAVVVFVCSAILLWIQKEELKYLFSTLKRKISKS